jgi:hypothetical protein
VHCYVVMPVFHVEIYVIGTEIRAPLYRDICNRYRGMCIAMQGYMHFYVGIYTIDTGRFA